MEALLALVLVGGGSLLVVFREELSRRGAHPALFAIGGSLAVVAGIAQLVDALR